MREVPDDERAEHLRRLREQAQRDAEALAPRPGHPVYGLAAPSLTPAAVTQYQLSDGEWSAITLTYGPWGDPQAGPYVAVTTMATDAATMAQAGSGPMQGDGPEAELRHAIEDEHYRFRGSIARRTEWAEPLAVIRETLPAGQALVCRSELVWAARLRHAMLGDTVPSEPAQDAWARYWSTHMARLGRQPESIDPRAAMSAREALTEDCLQAWAAWTETV